MADGRSGCPINLTVEVLGDSWSLLVIRDLMFSERRRYGELLAGSEEGIATNVLADRLRRLAEHGLITRHPDPTHRQKRVYRLTERAIQLVPVLVQLGAWGRRHLPVTPELAVRAELLERGGPELWAAFMDELRESHLGVPRPSGAAPVAARLRASYERAAAHAPTHPPVPASAPASVSAPEETTPS
ncbi:helix-turn-helix domain-containing protein [Streptomyces sp. SM12]|uniref:winged helix-turn-helix transcriptional regulator n=1 Tax=Streptomyces sp. SM12 TaxID=1071602 RepID=UPI000CD5853F|nr:helix-turn-helix domain-containing protein [Streptomyces sp. SM12]